MRKPDRTDRIAYGGMLMTMGAWTMSACLVMSDFTFSWPMLFFAAVWLAGILLMGWEAGSDA